MATIPTASGTIQSSEMGRTLVHEHVFVMNEEYRQNYLDWDETARLAEAANDLNALKLLGIDTIMDPTVLGLGRHIPRLKAVAARTNLSILVATGLYTFDALPFQFQYTGPGLPFPGPEPMTSLFVRDLTEGIADTGVRAAFLKCAIDQPGLTPGVERTLRAIAQAHVQTGAPITVHTHAGTRSGLVAQQVLREEGADLSKVIIGHSGDSTDLAYLTELADAGSLLGMDRFGLEGLLPTAQRIETVVALVKLGYVDSIVLSHDACCFIDWFPPGAQQRVNPRWNFRHISTDVIPALLEGGLTDNDITTILVDNPRRQFE